MTIVHYLHRPKRSPKPKPPKLEPIARIRQGPRPRRKIPSKAIERLIDPVESNRMRPKLRQRMLGRPPFTI